MAQGAQEAEPRWPALLALAGVGGLRLALPDDLAVGPRWLLLIVVTGLAIPTVLARRGGRHQVNQRLGLLLNGVVTLDMLWSLALLLRAMAAHSEPPLTMMRSAAALWVTNVLVFASWYWRLDAGGPHARDLRVVHSGGAFLFPQSSLGPDLQKAMGMTHWRPLFIDYLFLAFNTSTAFSPTDAPVLGRWAKALMMTQSLISLATVAFLAARAVNIL